MRLCIRYIYLSICSKRLTSGALDYETKRQQVCVAHCTHTLMQRVCVLTMFAECFHAQRRFGSSSQQHRGKSTVAASESNWNEIIWRMSRRSPLSCPPRKPEQKSSLLIGSSDICQHGFNHKLSSVVAQGMREASYSRRAEHTGRRRSV